MSSSTATPGRQCDDELEEEKAEALGCCSSSSPSVSPAEAPPSESSAAKDLLCPPAPADALPACAGEGEEEEPFGAQAAAVVR